LQEVAQFECCVLPSVRKQARHPTNHVVTKASSEHSLNHLFDV